VVSSADTGVAETESILSRLNIEIGPRLAVYQEDITVQRCCFMVDFGIPKTSIRVITLCGETKWDIVLSRWQVESSFRVIVKYVETSLSEISVLGGVINSMIVIP
jgi:hypothetical protein